ncbi:hypothetical protein LX81_00167 [Palleronia aestuarii]|uniref:Lipoprotein n=1 Tax=Palleronia aestuarii TaxID=568105 RepID=A0A2W7NIL2_9RHOB|nr:hypothetical protein [Palleronia aestuarii]PZX19710.1 hypothetical protein LX81_00167 [Palleronia aestuarii]
MGDTRKSLTVTYGAFSCTLEGFDDPFETMCAIAAYFRDLSEEAPNFGSEPLPPHQESLSAIAETASGAPVVTRTEDAVLVFERLGGGAEGPTSRDDADEVEPITGDDEDAAFEAAEVSFDRSLDDAATADDGAHLDDEIALPEETSPPTSVALPDDASDETERHLSDEPAGIEDTDEVDTGPSAVSNAGQDDSDESDDEVSEDARADGDDELAAGIRSILELGTPEEEDRDAALAEIERAARQADEENAQARRRARTLDELIAEGEEDADTAEPVPPSPEESRDPLEVESDAAFDRLMVETDAQMGDAAGHRRRSAIAHLKAAVAATKADGLLGGKRGRSDAETAGQFRSELDRAVRPKRPTLLSDQSTRPRPTDPTEESASPLVLVSSLRVGTDGAAENVGSVQPRRVPRDTAQPHDAGAFAAFAERIGATELTDIIEAAAAYGVIVEGRDALSRPHLLRQAASRSRSGASREDGLRSFERLVEAGHLRDLGRGRFGITGATRYVDEAQALVN